MIKDGIYHKLEYFDLLPLIFDFETNPQAPDSDYVHVEDIKGNRGIIGSYDCGLAFAVAIIDPIGRNDGFEMMASELMPILRSMDNMNEDEKQKFVKMKPEDRYMAMLREGFDIHGWGNLKRKDGKPLAIIENKNGNQNDSNGKDIIE